MKATYSLPLLAVLLTLVSCNEKISPQLQDANSTTLPPPTPAPKEYTFKVVDASPVLLNYQLHKVGAGNATARCEVTKNVPLSSNIFRYDPDSDITCFFEAEELSLYHAGMSFKVEATPNTCEFIGYEGFGFYTRMPGNSSTTMYELACTNDETNESHIADLPPAVQARLGTYNGHANCGQFVDDNLSVGTRAGFSVQEDADLCRFNYKDGNQEACDIGVINIQSVQMTFDQDSGTKYEIQPRTVFCGGRAANCVGGPTKQISPVHTRKVEITKSDKDAPFEKTYSYDGLINHGEGGRYSNREYVNFRRDLSSLLINFGNPDDDPTFYINAFGNPATSRTYTSKLMDNYSYNKKMDGTPLVTNAEIATAAIVTDGLGNELYTARPLAAEPFLGLGAANTVNPFYTFTCLDQGQDVKARIRLVVRDWDRIYPSTPSSMELISDISAGPSARMDMGLANVEEVPGENDSLLLFNDHYDWDDFIKMDRTLDVDNGGMYTPSGTVWKPADGWFERSLFPAGNL